MTEQNETRLESSPPPVRLTPKAIEMAKKKLSEGDIPNALGLRLGVKGGGCSGYYYVLDYATKIRGRDKVYDVDGLRVVVDDKSAKFLEGVTLDWEQKLMGYGFKWVNPNATGSCGCGESFSM